MNRKFTLNEILNDNPEVIKHDLEKQIEKKPKRHKGGNEERNSLLRAQLSTYEILLKKIQEIDAKLDEVLSR